MYQIGYKLLGQGFEQFFQDLFLLRKSLSEPKENLRKPIFLLDLAFPSIFEFVTWVVPEVLPKAMKKLTRTNRARQKPSFLAPQPVIAELGRSN